MEQIESKFDCSVHQLKIDLEQLGTDVCWMFEQMMAKMDNIHTRNKLLETIEEGSKSHVEVDSSQLKSGQPVLTGKASGPIVDSNSKYYKHA